MLKDKQKIHQQHHREITENVWETEDTLVVSSDWNRLCSLKEKGAVGSCGEQMSNRHTSPISMCPVDQAADPDWLQRGVNVIQVVLIQG